MMGSKAFFSDQPFEEAIEFFLQKTNLPSEKWYDVWQEMHTQAFTVAGAMEEDLLQDLYDAVSSAIKDEMSLNDFRASFSEIVKRHGWTYKGTEAWRSAVIFNTNISLAYHYGHYQAMLDPVVAEKLPYWRYVESSSPNPRKSHMQWYGLILPYNDPFWLTHAPPNGWGCKCGIAAMSEHQVEKYIKTNAFAKMSAPEITYYDWKNPKTGETIKVPEGIDPGWGYHPGLNPWGEK